MRITERDARENFLRSLKKYKSENIKTEESLIEVAERIRYVEMEARSYIQEQIRGEDAISHAIFI